MDKKITIAQIKEVAQQAYDLYKTNTDGKNADYIPLFGRSLFFCPYMNWIKEGVYENTDSPFMHALMNFVFIS